MGGAMTTSDPNHARKSPRPAGAAGGDPASEGIYRAIQWLLFLDVVLGLGLAVVGSEVLAADSVVYAGVGLAVVGLLLMIFFRVLAGREVARRKHDQAADPRADFQGE